MISIRRRLTLLLGLGIGLILIITGLGIFFTFKDVLQSRFDETLTAKAQALITASEIDGGDFEIDLTVKKFAGFGKQGDDFFQIRRRNGSEFLNSPALKKSPEIYEAFSRFSWPDEESGTIQNGSLGENRPARFYIQPIYPKDDKRDEFQDLYLIVASPTESLQNQLSQIAVVLSVAGATALLLIFLVIRSGLRKGLLPLEKLSREVSEIQSDQLDRRLPSKSLPSELTPLAISLNAWLAELEKSFERERRFTRHAAHELRTPLAELKLMAELGSMDPDEATPAHCAEMLVVTNELSTLLEKLSLLARTDARQAPVTVESVDVIKSIHSVLARFQQHADSRSLTINTQFENGTIQTDPLLWRTILQNIIGNAVTYAPAGSKILISASPETFSITNQAPDLNQEDLAHFFERFWRKDIAHSGYGHSGLGMSIVESHAKLLGATCRVSIDHGSLTVEIDLNIENRHVVEPEAIRESSRLNPTM